MENKIFYEAKIVFFRWKWLIANIIMFFSGKPYSHIGVQVWPYYYEAWFIWGFLSMLFDSKILKTLDNTHYHKKWTDVDIMTIPWRFDISWLDRQVWKAYDFPAIWGYIITKIKQDPNRWYCSELVYQFLIKMWTLEETTKLPSPSKVFEILINKWYKITETNERKTEK